MCHTDQGSVPCRNFDKQLTWLALKARNLSLDSALQFYRVEEFNELEQADVITPTSETKYTRLRVLVTCSRYLEVAWVLLPHSILLPLNMKFVHLFLFFGFFLNSTSHVCISKQCVD